MPSVKAAMAGAKIDPAALAIACVTATSVKLDMSGNVMLASVTSRAAAIVNPRLARLLSISAPAGVCATIPARAAIDMTMPMLASFHFCSVSR